MSKDGNKQVVKQPNSEQDPQDPRDPKDPLQKRVLSILRGKEEPPNEMIAYIVGRAKKTRAQAEELMDEMEKQQTLVEKIKTRVIELRGASLNYADDVRALLENLAKEASPQRKVVVPEKRVIVP
jgi:hypothetical protein